VFDRLRWEEKTLLEESQKLGVESRLVDSKSIVFDTARGLSEDLGSLAYMRCVSHYRALTLSAIVESLGVKCVNKHTVLETCSNKLFTTLALKAKGVPTPRTLMALSAEGVAEAARQIGFPLVLKPLVGSWGRLVSLAKDSDTLSSLVEHREELANPLDQLYYIQEYVRRPPRDIRAIVAGDRIVAAVYRVSSDNDWRTNVARGARTEPLKVTGELEDIILRAAEAVGGGVLGVDAMEAQDGFVVHEVNGTVEFKGAQAASTNNIAQQIVEYLVEEAKK